jgi:hypothetical protein
LGRPFGGGDAKNRTRDERPRRAEFTPSLHRVSVIPWQRKDRV